MTREQATERKAKLEARLFELEDQLVKADVSQATLSSGTGSKSYSNRSVADIERKIRYVKREIARLNALLTGRPSPGSIQTVYARFDA